MGVNLDLYTTTSKQLKAGKVTLVAVSKTKPVSEITALYRQGQRDFGENYVQELLEKHQELPQDIRWHFIGHLQSNKVKLIAPFISLIQSVDSQKLLLQIDKEARKNNRVIDCLLQVHVADEETKFGMNKNELNQVMPLVKNTESGTSLKNVCIKGLMGMASFTPDKEKIKKEFGLLKSLFDHYSEPQFAPSHWKILSMGMSSDYQLAIEEGSNMVRIGSLLFGERT